MSEFSHSSGGSKSEMKVLADWMLPRPLSLFAEPPSGCRFPCSCLCVSTSLCPSLCTLISSSHKDTGHAALRPTRAASFWLSYLFKAPISRYSHTVRYWGRGEGAKFSPQHVALLPTPSLLSPARIAQQGPGEVMSGLLSFPRGCPQIQLVVFSLKPSLPRQSGGLHKMITASCESSPFVESVQIGKSGRARRTCRRGRITTKQC